MISLIATSFLPALCSGFCELLDDASSSLRWAQDPLALIVDASEEMFAPITTVPVTPTAATMASMTATASATVPATTTTIPVIPATTTAVPVAATATITTTTTPVSVPATPISASRSPLVVQPTVVIRLGRGARAKYSPVWLKKNANELCGPARWVSQSIATAMEFLTSLVAAAIRMIEALAKRLRVRSQRRGVSSPAALAQPPTLPAEGPAPAQLTLAVEEARRRADEERVQRRLIMDHNEEIERHRLARDWDERRRIARELFRQFLLRRRPNSEDVVRNTIKRQTCPRLRACTPFGCTRG